MTKSLLPIRKVAVGALSYAILEAARRLHVIHFGSAEAQDYAQGIATFVTMYVLPDPRVQKLEVEGKASLIKRVTWLMSFADEQTRPPVTPPPPADIISTQKVGA